MSLKNRQFCHLLSPKHLNSNSQVEQRVAMFKRPLEKIQRKGSIRILCTLLRFKQFLANCVIVFMVFGLPFFLDFLSFCIKLSINIIENTLLCGAQLTKPNSQRYVNMLPC